MKVLITYSDGSHSNHSINKHADYINEAKSLVGQIIEDCDIIFNTVTRKLTEVMTSKTIISVDLF